jgi:endonuclease/exonuclease/phosphatase (EEP) superfamily protein YafD
MATQLVLSLLCRNTFAIPEGIKLLTECCMMGKIVLQAVGYFLVVISLIPLVRNDNWMFRIFEYPRFQKLIINVGVLLGFAVAYPIRGTGDYIFVAILMINLGYLIYQIWPYTVAAKLQMQKVSDLKECDKVSLLICNVFQDNRESRGLLRQISLKKPDLVLVVEVDHWWTKQLEVLHHDYQYRVLHPLDNTYGMCLYSKFELEDSEVKFLIERDIPSIHAKIILPSGRKFRLYGLHPEPPVPQENPRSTERDAEILLVGKEAKQASIPVIVAGDLNDVAWSYTTELFLKVSCLLDPRRGRGFYSTFHSKYPLFRWPLDHVFCSRHFSLLELHRLPNVGSDHFPIFIAIQLTEEKIEEQAANELSATSDEEATADEKISVGRES